MFAVVIMRDRKFKSEYNTKQELNSWLNAVCRSRDGSRRPIAYDVMEPPLRRSRTFSPRYAALHGSDALGLTLAAQCCMASRAVACLRRSGDPISAGYRPLLVYIYYYSMAAAVRSVFISCALFLSVRSLR